MPLVMGRMGASTACSLTHPNRIPAAVYHLMVLLRPTRLTALDCRNNLTIAYLSYVGITGFRIVTFSEAVSFN